MISYNFVFCILCVCFLINICVFPTLGSARPLFIEWATQADLVFTLLTLDPVLLHPPACTLFAEMCVLFHTILYMHLFLLCCHTLEVSCFCVVFLRSKLGPPCCLDRPNQLFVSFDRRALHHHVPLLVQSHFFPQPFGRVSFWITAIVIQYKCE